MVCVRIRLRFDSSPLQYAKKCWFLFDADQCSLVKDVAFLIARQFDLNQDIQLYMDDFLIPVNESAQVIRDNDLIRVKTIEYDASLVPSDDTQPPKAKRKKLENTDKQKKKTIPTNESARTVPIQNLTSANTVMKRVITQPKTTSEKLRAVTKKSSTGALHTTFHSSSSSSSSESESSSSEPEVAAASSSQKNKAIVDKNQHSNSAKIATKPQAQPGNSKVPQPNRSLLPLGGDQSGNKLPVTNASRSRRGGRNRKRTLSTALIVGGHRDVLTTKSTLYKSPVQQRRSGSGTATTKHHNAGKKSSSSDSSSSSESEKSAPVTNKSPVTSTKQCQKETEKPPSQWDVWPEAPVASSSSAPPLPEPTLQLSQAPRDYSTLLELQGPPRQGDRLAFKVLELSSSYTPGVSEYKEATVLSYDPSSKMVHVEYTEETLLKLKSQSKTKPGKFEIQLGGDDLEDQEPQVNRYDDVALDSLIDPKLMV